MKDDYPEYVHTRIRSEGKPPRLRVYCTCQLHHEIPDPPTGHVRVEEPRRVTVGYCGKAGAWQWVDERTGG